MPWVCIYLSAYLSLYLCTTISRFIFFSAQNFELILLPFFVPSIINRYIIRFYQNSPSPLSRIPSTHNNVNPLFPSFLLSFCLPSIRLLFSLLLFLILHLFSV